MQPPSTGDGRDQRASKLEQPNRLDHWYNHAVARISVAALGLALVALRGSAHADKSSRTVEVPTPTAWYCFTYQETETSPVTSRCSLSEKVCELTRSITESTGEDGPPITLISPACRAQPKAAVLKFRVILQDSTIRRAYAAIKDCKADRAMLLRDEDAERVSKCRIMTPKQGAKWMRKQ